MDASDRFVEVAVGAHGLADGTADLVAHDRVAHQGQHQQQGHGAEGHQGEQGTDGQQHHQKNQAESEVDHRGERLPQQKLAQAIELVEVEHHLAHRPAVEEALGQPHQLVEDGALGGLVDAVGGFGEDEAAQGFEHPLHQGGQHHHGADAHQGAEAAALHHLIDQHHQPEGRHQFHHVGYQGGGGHFH